MNVINRVKTDIIENCLIDRGDRVLVALSGGSDSVALLHILSLLSQEMGFELCAAHINHKIRNEADSDEEFVKRLCDDEGIACYVKRADVISYAKEKSISTELAGREIRYSFFEELKEKYSINKIATAHNKNDSAESILLHLIRGCGIGGLSGIPRERNGYIIRPILSLTKSEIEDYCKENNLSYVVDKTNFETDYARNKIRLELIPLIEKELNSGFIHTVTANSILFGETERFLNKLSACAYESAVCDGVADVELLLKNDKIIVRLVIQKMYAQFSKSEEKLSHKFTDTIIELIESGKKSKSVNLPLKISAKYEHNKLFFEKTDKKICKFDYPIEENRELYIKECNCGFILKRETQKEKNTDKKAYFYLDDISGLHIRNRRMGDSLKPVGMDGTKKLSDLFCDMKIPSAQRDIIPLLVKNNEIIWVVGKRLDRRFQKGKNLYSITVNYREEIKMQKGFKGIGKWIIAIFVIMLFYQSFMSIANPSVSVSYSDFINLVKKESISKIDLCEDEIEAIVKNADDIPEKYVARGQSYLNTIDVRIPSTDALYSDVGEEINEQTEKGVLEFTVCEPGLSWISLISPIISIILFIMIIMFFVSNMGGKSGNMFTKNRAKLMSDSAKKTKFADVAGAVEEKEELMELVDFLKSPEKFIKLGARIPKGVLLVGSPGTGKTLLARAVAGEAGVPFFSISGSDFVELYVGVGASRVRDLFEQAKKNRPCIVFIDEIDAVGRKRGAGMGGGHDEREQTLNQLLVEMDGFGVNEGIIMIAATNRPDILDPALLRPGRFDRQIVVDVPDVAGREEILKVHSQSKPLDESVDLSRIAKVTSGYTGADLENLMNEAAIFAVRRNKEKIDSSDIEDANIKVMMGAEKKSRKTTEKEKRLTAYHEAGHAIVSKLIDKEEKIHQVSIIPRGRAGGYTMYTPKDDVFYSSKNDMLNDIIKSLGGRAAEEVMLDDISTGASGDIRQATKVARAMITRYGMNDKLGLVCYDTEEEVFLGRDYAHSKTYSDQTAAKIDEEIKNVISQLYEKTKGLLEENKDLLEKVAAQLLEKETLNEQEFEQIFNSFNNDLN